MRLLIGPEPEVTLATTMHWVPLQPVGRAPITVAGHLTGDGGEVKGAVLLVADFEPAVVKQEELAETGFYLSTKFGPFVYIQSSGPDGNFSARFSQPEGRVLRRLGFRLFRCESPLKLTNLKIALLAQQMDHGAPARQDGPSMEEAAQDVSQAQKALSSAQIHWLELPDTIGNRVTIAGPWPDKLAHSVDGLHVAAELDIIPRDSILASNGLVPVKDSDPFPRAPVRLSGKSEYRATFSIPDGSALKRVGLVSHLAGLEPSAATVSRAIHSPREGDVLVNISVDTEALPGRATSDHVDRLIYGRVNDGEYGIPTQMRVFKELGIPATFYLECGQCALWGSEAISEVGKRVLDAGFDLQLHLHSELLARAHHWKWTRPVPPMLHNLDRAETFRALGFAVEQFYRIAGRLPDSFRAGAYLFNPHTLHALHELGIRGSSNYRADQRPKNAYDFEGPAPMRPFRWSNGIFEFPITLSPEPLSALAPRECWRRILHHVQVNQTWVVNVVIHSWSFMRRDADGHQIWHSSELMDNLIKFIEVAPSGVRFVSIRDVVDSARDGTMAVLLEKDIGALVERAGTAAR